MKDRPEVSVIVPFYNSERSLAACIESLLGQDMAERCEIILIDNRSEDSSSQIAKAYDGITLLDEQTPGAYAARNTGIKQATAPLIAFTDADCVVDPDWLHSIIEGMKDPRTAVLLGHCRYPENATATLKLLAAYENAKTDYVVNRCPPAYRFAYCNNMAVRASVFEEIGPFEEWQRAADSELVHRLASRRPDLELVYHPSMRISHLEFVRARDRARRLSLYTNTNSKIETFRELGVIQRLGVLARLMR